MTVSNDCILDADGVIVARVSDDSHGEQSAIFICRCVNNHQALVHAMRISRPYLLERAARGGSAQYDLDVIDSALATALEEKR